MPSIPRTGDEARRAGSRAHSWPQVPGVFTTCSRAGEVEVPGAEAPPPLPHHHVLEPRTEDRLRSSPGPSPCLLRPVCQGEGRGRSATVHTWGETTAGHVQWPWARATHLQGDDGSSARWLGTGARVRAAGHAGAGPHRCAKRAGTSSRSSPTLTHIPLPEHTDPPPGPTGLAWGSGG